MVGYNIFFLNLGPVSVRVEKIDGENITLIFLFSEKNRWKLGDEILKSVPTVWRIRDILMQIRSPLLLLMRIRILYFVREREKNYFLQQFFSKSYKTGYV